MYVLPVVSGGPATLVWVEASSVSGKSTTTGLCDGLAAWTEAEIVCMDYND